jgi:hypothetical protein
VQDLWEELVKIFLQHPIACLISFPLSVYLTFISARGIGRDTKRRNEKLGIVYPARARQEFDNMAVGAVFVLFLAFLAGIYFLLTWIGSILPFQFGL